MDNCLEAKKSIAMSLCGALGQNRMTYWADMSWFQNFQLFGSGDSLHYFYVTIRWCSGSDLLSRCKCSRAGILHVQAHDLGLQFQKSSHFCVAEQSMCWVPPPLKGNFSPKSSTGIFVPLLPPQTFSLCFFCCCKNLIFFPLPSCHKPC